MSLAPPAEVTPSSVSAPAGQSGIGTFISPLSGTVATGTSTGGPQFDALYIAELPWVRLRFLRFDGPYD